MSDFTLYKNNGNVLRQLFLGKMYFTNNDRYQATFFHQPPLNTLEVVYNLGVLKHLELKKSDKIETFGAQNDRQEDFKTHRDFKL